MHFKIFPLLVVFLVLMAANTSAQSQKNFAVLPFEVHGPQEYQYLAQGIQSMLSSRLARPGHSQSISPGEVNRLISKHPETTGEAEQMRSTLNADFLVYGTVTIMDRETSLDVHTIAADRSFDPILKQPSLSALIPSLEEVAADLVAQTIPHAADTEIEPVVSAPPAPRPPAEEEVYVSPHFRFEDDPYAAGRWRSQSLSFNGVGIALGKSSPNFEQTIFILGERRVHAYRMQEDRMMPIAVYEAPIAYKCLNINAFDINRNGSHEILVSAVQDERSRSFILSFENDEFNVLYERIPFYLNLVNMPPDYRPAMIGQRPATSTRLFNPGSVQEVIMTSEGPQLGGGVPLPPMANVFNFNFLPSNSEHLVVLAENDRLKVFNQALNLLYTTSDEYSGTNIGLEYYQTMPGLARGSDQDPDFYFIPSRLVPIQFNSDGKYFLLAHKHYAGLTRLFARQRNFSEGEVRALFWDEIGLSIHWNTRKIRASVIDYGVYDFDGDGNNELVVLVNTHPGITGLQSRNAIVLSYKMDF